MVEETTQTPEGNEETLTPEGTETEETPQTQVVEGSPAPEVDYKEKFSESKKEALRIREEAKEKDLKIAELETKLKNETPSEAELAKKHADWEFKDESEKTRIRSEEAREKRVQELEEKLAWKEDFENVTNEFPQLKETDFKEYAYKYPKSVDLKTLAKSYLYEHKVEPTKTEPVKERKGLEVPTGGSGKVPSGAMTLKDVENLRNNNPRLYAKMIREGKLKTIPEK